MLTGLYLTCHDKNHFLGTSTMSTCFRVFVLYCLSLKKKLVRKSVNLKCYQTHIFNCCATASIIKNTESFLLLRDGLY